jgi:hypothetical protein
MTRRKPTAKGPKRGPNCRQIAYSGHLISRLRLGPERHSKERDRENHEPDPPHGHLVEDGWRESSRLPRRAPVPCGSFRRSPRNSRARSRPVRLLLWRQPPNHVQQIAAAVRLRQIGGRPGVLCSLFIAAEREGGNGDDRGLGCPGAWCSARMASMPETFCPIYLADGTSYVGLAWRFQGMYGAPALGTRPPHSPRGSR